VLKGRFLAAADVTAALAIEPDPPRLIARTVGRSDRQDRRRRPAANHALELTNLPLSQSRQDAIAILEGIDVPSNKRLIFDA
jgi:hypothetical protein